MSQARGRRHLFTKLALVLLVVLGLALAYHYGVFAQLKEPRSLAQRLRELGVWGYLWFLLSFAFLQPFGVPGTVFVVAAALIWPWKTAFLLSLAGSMAASSIGFSFARFVAQDWFSARIPLRFRKYQDALEQRALTTVVVLRMLFWMPQILHSFFGVSKVSFWTHFWGSLLGYIPPLLMISFLGGQLFDDAGNLQTDSWPIFVGFIAAVLALAAGLQLLERRRQRRAAQK